MYLPLIYKEFLHGKGKAPGYYLSRLSVPSELSQKNISLMSGLVAINNSDSGTHHLSGESDVETP